jgi:Protein of unknown function (DUF2785)
LNTSSARCRCYFLSCSLITMAVPAIAASPHDISFWKSIAEHDFAIPAGEDAGRLALEIADLAGSPDPVLRDNCGYETLAAWIYRDHRLTPNELETLRQKLLPAVFFHIGESGNDTIFRRSFSALYMSILAAEDLKKPFLSKTAFQETLDAGLRCFAEEKDLRGYVVGKGWAHATAHVADLLKFLARNDKMSPELQKRVVLAAAQRARTANSVFVWGEDARIAAALLSLINRKDFDPSGFRDWFGALVPENRELWKSTAIEPNAYASVRVQANVLAHLSAKIAAEKETFVTREFRSLLNATLSQVN